MRKTIYSINWGPIQIDHDSGMIQTEITKKYGISSASLNKANKKGLIKLRNVKESLLLQKRTHTEESRKKISETRKKYLRDNPDKIPYLLNHKHKRKFYSEEYFNECLKDTNFINEYKVDTYSLDFAEVVNKIDLEIDGNQHFYDKKIIEHDKKRNFYLSCLGWTIIRIKWSEFLILSLAEKQRIVKDIIKFKNPIAKCVAFIKPNENLDLIEYYKKISNIKKLHGMKSCECGKMIEERSKKCQTCRFLKKCPYTKSELHTLIWAFPKEELYKNKIIRLSRKNLEKWIKEYELNPPPSGYFLKKIIDYQI